MSHIDNTHNDPRQMDDPPLHVSSAREGRHEPVSQAVSRVGLGEIYF